MGQNRGSVLQCNQHLDQGDYLLADNGCCWLRMQDDGNFVLYAQHDTPIWASGTAGQGGTFITMQPDGNLCMYNEDNDPVWASNSAGGNLPDCQLCMQDDGNVVVYPTQERSNAIWLTNTSFTRYRYAKFINSTNNMCGVLFKRLIGDQTVRDSRGPRDETKDMEKKLDIQIGPRSGMLCSPNIPACVEASFQSWAKKLTGDGRMLCRLYIPHPQRGGQPPRRAQSRVTLQIRHIGRIGIWSPICVV